LKPQGITSGSYLFDNPTTALIMGLCPAIAVSARVLDALWMSLSVALVLLLTSLALALVARARPRQEDGSPEDERTALRIGALFMAAALTGAVEVLLTAYLPEASASLGIYAPLIAVNCLVLNIAEKAKASRSIGRSVLDALAAGLSFAGALIAIAFVREVLGAGTITFLPWPGFGGTVAVPGLSRNPIRALGFAGGGLLCLGYLAAGLRVARRRREAGAKAATQ
jgi:Na+-translocating ferredoxin:NAD+ oxidoreductase subunit E